MKRAFECGRNFQLTGENNFKELIEEPNQALPQGDFMRSASDFKSEIIIKLTAFYAYGEEYGYSNIELSRIRSCITKVEETHV